jgi:protein-L-isoaspartate O-methyltransferase
MSDELEKKFVRRSDPYTHDIVIELCKKYINSGDKVLDVGCGSGYQ